MQRKTKARAVNLLEYDGNNSCYIDSLVVALFASYANKWIVDTFLKGSSKNKVRQVLRMLYTQVRIKDAPACVLRLRSAIKEYFDHHGGVSADIEWMREQNDPNDVIDALCEALSIKADVHVEERTPSTKRHNKVRFNAFMVDAGVLMEHLSKHQVLHLDTFFPKFPISENSHMKILKIGGGLYIPIMRNWLDEKKLRTIVLPPAKILDAKLCAILIHNGKSPHYGHYTAILRNKNGWVLYDDMDGGRVEDIGKKLGDVWKHDNRYVCKNMSGLLYLKD